MTTALILGFYPKCDVLSLGFVQGDQDTWIRWDYHIPSPGFEFIAVTATGKALFPEDFPHKRAYLKTLKAEKAKLGPYRFGKEFITFLDSLDVHIIRFWVGMVDDFPGFNHPKHLHVLHGIVWPPTLQTLFEPDVCYRITKPLPVQVLKPAKKLRKGCRF